MSQTIRPAILRACDLPKGTVRELRARRHSAEQWCECRCMDCGRVTGVRLCRVPDDLPAVSHGLCPACYFTRTGKEVRA